MFLNPIGCIILNFRKCSEKERENPLLIFALYCAVSMPLLSYFLTRSQSLLVAVLARSLALNECCCRRLLTAWSLERPTSAPLKQDMWCYRSAWRDWVRWHTGGSHLRVKARCQAFGVQMAIDGGWVGFSQSSQAISSYYY